MLAVAEIEIVRDRITLAHLRLLAESLFGDLVKAVVDIERGVMAIGGELHADEEAVLLDAGSTQGALGGSTSTRPTTALPAGSNSTR